MSDMQQHHHHLDPLAWAVLQFQDVLRDISYAQLCTLAETNNVPMSLAPAEGKEKAVTRYHDTMMDARKRSHVEDDLVLLFEDSATGMEMGAVGASSCEHSITSSIRHVPLIYVSVSFSFFFFFLRRILPPSVSLSLQSRASQVDSQQLTPRSSFEERCASRVQTLTSTQSLLVVNSSYRSFRD